MVRIRHTAILVITLILSLFLALTTAGCSGKKAANNQGTNTSSAAKQNELGSVVVMDTVKQPDITMSNKLKAEKNVLDGEIYMQGNIIYCAVIMKGGTKEDEAKSLAQRYLDEIKLKFKDKKINVQVLGDGKNLANLTN